MQIFFDIGQMVADGGPRRLAIAGLDCIIDRAVMIDNPFDGFA